MDASRKRKDRRSVGLVPNWILVSVPVFPNLEKALQTSKYIIKGAVAGPKAPNNAVLSHASESTGSR